MLKLNKDRKHKWAWEVPKEYCVFVPKWRVRTLKTIDLLFGIPSFIGTQGQHSTYRRLPEM